MKVPVTQPIHNPADSPVFSVWKPMAVVPSPLIQVSLSLMMACGGSVGISSSRRGIS